MGNLTNKINKLVKENLVRKINSKAFLLDAGKLIVEEEALKQLENTSKLDGIYEYVIATADIHKGYGCPIGTVLASKDIVLPASVGFDINCGVRLLYLDVDFDANRKKIKSIFDKLFKIIPVGEGKTNLNITKYFKDICNFGLDFSKYKSVEFHPFLNEDEIEIAEGIGKFEAKFSLLSKRALERGFNQMGTLGGGNHFLEVGKIEEIFDSDVAKELNINKNGTYILIHTGSRGLGHQIGSEYMQLAKNLRVGEVPDPQLAFFYLTEEFAEKYLLSMGAAANWAYVNRSVIAGFVKKVFYEYFGNKIKTIYDISHNIARWEKINSKELLIHRKGAVLAYDFENKKEKLIILPGSMGTASYVLMGNSPDYFFYSAPHGAGRLISRRKARGRRGKEGLITDNDLKKQLSGIHIKTNSFKALKEEAPAVYKDINLVVDIMEKLNVSRKVLKLVPKMVMKG